jgi:hypothetical protein
VVDCYTQRGFVKRRNSQANGRSYETATTRPALILYELEEGQKQEDNTGEPNKQQHLLILYRIFWIGL